MGKQKYSNDKYNGKKINDMFNEIYKSLNKEVNHANNNEEALISAIKDKVIDEGKVKDKTVTIRTFLRKWEDKKDIISERVEKNLRKLDSYINLYELESNYEDMGKAFCIDWNIHYRRNQGLRGKFAETKAKSFIEKIIAKKYVLLENVVIISSDGNLSPEIDLVICSLEYMPPIFENHGFCYIPLESVIGIVQVKIGGIGDAQRHIKEINDQFKEATDKDNIKLGSVVAENDRVVEVKNKYFYPIRILIQGEENKKVEGYDFTLYVGPENNDLTGFNTSPKNSRLIAGDTTREDKKIKGYLDFMLSLNEELIKINNPNIFNYRKYQDLFFNTEEEK